MKSPFGRFIEGPIARIQPYAILVIALCLIFIGIVLGHLYLNSFEDKTFRAWQLVTSNDHRVSGKKEALEYLNRVDGILCFDNDWCAIPLKRRTRLPGLVLPVSPGGQGSHLSLIDLRNALLVDADFSGAWMRGADLRGADLRGVNFSRTRLHNADLRGARLAGRTIPPGQKQGRTDVLKGDLLSHGAQRRRSARDRPNRPGNARRDVQGRLRRRADQAAGGLQAAVMRGPAVVSRLSCEWKAREVTHHVRWTCLVQTLSRRQQYHR
ncbi:MAG: pentapeptide repeat-containing protein [Geminicoccaceae bacterium]